MEQPNKNGPAPGVGAEPHNQRALPSSDDYITPADRLAYALNLAASGIPVFPCNADKTPAVNHWKEDATTDPEQIQAWTWSGLIGVPTGKASGLAVLDVDIDRDKGKDGAAALKAAGLEPPETQAHHTRRGGFHYLYRHRDGLRNSAGQIATDVDVRGEGGYLIWWPAEGLPVEHEGAIADAPAWMTPKSTPRTVAPVASIGNSDRYADRAMKDAIANVTMAADGARNDTLNREALGLYGFALAGRLSEPAITGALSRAASSAGLPDGEIAPTLASARGAAVARPVSSDGRAPDGYIGNAKRTGAIEWSKPIPLPTPSTTGAAGDYPIEHLPAALRDMVGAVAEFVRVPVASPALVGISVLATAIGKKATIQERRGLVHHPALFLVGIAGSGERKSPVFTKMAYPLEQWRDSQIPKYEELRAEAESNNSVVAARIKALTRKAEKDDADTHKLKSDIALLKGQVIPIPPYPSPFTDDVTEQRVVQLLHEHGGAYAVMAGEGRGVFDNLLGKYSGDGNTGEGVYLKGISGDTISRQRVGNGEGAEERVIRHPCLNVCVMVQPDKYGKVAGNHEMREAGTIARIWPVWLPSLVGSRMESADDPDFDPGQAAGYNRIAYALLNHEPATDDSGRAIPHRAILSSEAQTMRRELHNAIEAMMVDDGDLADCRDIASKATSQIVKLALVLHLADRPELIQQPESEVSATTWQAAQAIGVYHLNEAVRVQRVADEDPMLRMARKLLAWIQRERLTEVTGRQVQRTAPRPRPKNAEEARKVLGLLCDHHHLMRVDQGRGRSDLYRVNPESVATVANVAGGST